MEFDWDSIYIIFLAHLERNGEGSFDQLKFNGIVKKCFHIYFQSHTLMMLVPKT